MNPEPNTVINIGRLSPRTSEAIATELLRLISKKHNWHWSIKISSATLDGIRHDLQGHCSDFGLRIEAYYRSPGDSEVDTLKFVKDRKTYVVCEYSVLFKVNSVWNKLWQKLQEIRESLVQNPDSEAVFMSRIHLAEQKTAEALLESLRKL